MIFRDLPPEIQSRILEFCSPCDLAVLSRVHTLGRDMAEYALYSRIQFRARPSDLIIPSRDIENDVNPQELKEDRSLLHTFSNNSRKASMVKTFYVQLEDGNTVTGSLTGPYFAYIKSTHFILVKLAEGLVKMSNLVDLRILHGRLDYYDFQVDGLNGTRRISEVIRGNYFKLHTLYLECYHYLEGIIADKPHLRLLGIHYNSHRVPRINQLHQDLSRCHTMPTVFALAFLLKGPTITMFPVFHHPGEALRACREVATSLTNGLFRKDRYHLSVSLLGTSEENISSLNELMEAMVTCLQDYCPRGCAHFRVIIHEESIQKPWRFPEFVKPLACFEDVRILDVDYMDISYEKWYQMATDLEFCMLKKLKRAWPILQEIRFFCYKLTPDVLVMKRESNWKVIECTSELEPLDEVLGIAVVSDDE